MLVRMWVREDIHPLLAGLKTCIATIEISAAVPQEAVNIYLKFQLYHVSSYSKDTMPYSVDAC